MSVPQKARLQQVSGLWSCSPREGHLPDPPGLHCQVRLGSVSCPFSLRFTLPGPLLCHFLSRCTGDPALHQRRPPFYSCTPATAGVDASTECIYRRCQQQTPEFSKPNSLRDLGLDAMQVKGLVNSLQLSKQTVFPQTWYPASHICSDHRLL